MGIWSRLVGRGLTASASSVSTPRALNAYSGRAREVSEAWRVWRQVGEIHYTTTQQARQVSRLHWDVLIDQELLTPKDRDDLMYAAFGRDLPELARQSALHYQVAGGYYLVRFPARSEWEIVPHPVSHQQLKQLEQADVIVMVLNPDPIDPKLTDSPVLASLDVARELLLVRAQARAAARSRTAQLQTVIYPNEAVPDTKKFESDMIAVMTAPIEDEYSTASVAPNLIGFPGDRIDQWRTLDLTGPVDERLHAKIEGLIRQLAVIMDAPPEILTGMGDVNHWGQWGIQEDNWLGHVEPMAKAIGRGFSIAIARAAELQEDSVEILPDPGPLLRRRPSVPDVLRAYELDLVSGDWTREQLGADEDDAPDTQEIQSKVRLGRTGSPRDPAPQEEPEEPQVAAVVQPSGAFPNASEVVQPSRAFLSAPETSSEVVQLAAAGTDFPLDSARLLAVDFQLMDSTEDLLELAVSRAVERIGAQIRSRAQGNPELKERIGDAPNDRLPHLVGVEGLSGVQDTIQRSIEPILERFDSLVRRAYQDARGLGVDIEPVDLEVLEATQLLVSGLIPVVMDDISGRPIKASIWGLTRRAVTVAGGGTDPIVSDPTVASPLLRGFTSHVVGVGVALGRRAMAWIRRTFGREPSHYIWRHRYRGDSPHPYHVTFEGRVFDGVTLDNDDGIEWFPGDHPGCRCGAEPEWSRR